MHISSYQLYHGNVVLDYFIPTHIKWKISWKRAGLNLLFSLSSIYVIHHKMQMKNTELSDDR